MRAVASIVVSACLLPLALVAGSDGAFASASSTILPAPSAVATTPQECGDWSRPVVCDVELRVNRGSWSWDRLDPRDPLTVPPGERIEIEIAARDQWGRTFPPDRLVLGYGSRDCGGVIEVDGLGEGRLRLEGDSIGERCRLELFVPGNLNFEWLLEIEVRRDASAGYSVEESEAIVRALYRALLGRDVDQGSLGPAMIEIQRGRLEAQIQAMVRSGEFNQANSTLSSADVLGRFYEGLLSRRPDSSAVRDLLPAVERRRYAEVILAIIRSPEFEERVLGNR